MNEANTKKIIKDSLLSPSDNFTQNVMQKIKSEPVKKKRPTLFFLYLACALILILLIMIRIPEYELLNRSIDISPIFIQIPGALFILYMVRQIIEIHENMSRVSYE